LRSEFGAHILRPSTESSGFIKRSKYLRPSTLLPVSEVARRYRVDYIFDDLVVQKMKVIFVCTSLLNFSWYYL